MSNYTRRYVLALTLIAISIITAATVSIIAIKNQENSAELINISGRQRMLSQQIALISTQLVNEGDYELMKSFQQDLITSVKVMEKSHQNLINNEYDSFSDNVKDIYFNKLYNLDALIRNYIKETYALAAENNNVTKENEHYLHIVNSQKELLNTIDLAVNQYQTDIESQVYYLEKIETSALFFTLFLMSLEVIFIFRPMVVAIHREKEELERLSSLDGLTGIANRRYMDEYLSREYNRAIRTASPLSIILTDIDFFKFYNDTYGHQEGDECLKKVTSTLSRVASRPGDLVARYGGEEFLIVLPETDLNGALTVAKELREEIERLKIEHKSSKISDYVTISLGVVTMDKSSKATISTLISAADAALYKAKQDGRNKVCLANETA